MIPGDRCELPALVLVRLIGTTGPVFWHCLCFVAGSGVCQGEALCLRFWFALKL
jgi:hypothetical protein